MPVRGEFEKVIKLPNGMQIAVMPFAKKTRVHIWLCVQTGSWDGYLPRKTLSKDLPMVFSESSDNQTETLVYCPAVDHATEHLIFKGTDDPLFRNPRKVSNFYAPRNRDDEDEHGADTQELVVRYYSEVQPEELELALRFISALTLRSILKRTDRKTKKKLLLEWEKEKNVIRHEKGWNTDEALSLEVSERNRQRMFPGHPLGYTVEGEKEEIETLTLKDLQTRYRTRSHPAKFLLIVIGGGINPLVVKKLTQKYFRAPRRKLLEIPVPKPYIPLSLPAQNRIQFIPLKRDMVYIALGFPFSLPQTNTQEVTTELIKRIYSVQILKKVFGGRWSSLPFIELREKRGIGYRHYGDLEEFPGVGILTYRTFLLSDELGQGGSWLRILLRILKKLATKLISEEDFDFARRAVLDEFNSDAETPGKLAEFIYRWVRFNGAVPLYDELKKLIITITPEDVLQAAKEIIVPERLFATFAGNLPSEKAQRRIRTTIKNWELS